MGRKSEITQDQINEVCKRIKTEGNNPTVDRVRLELGTGSRTTINQMIRMFEKYNIKNNILHRSEEMEAAFDRLINITGKTYETQIKDLQSEIDNKTSLVQHYLIESGKYLQALEEQQKTKNEILNENNQLKLQVANKDEKISQLEKKLDDLLNISQLFKMLQMENTMLKKESHENKANTKSFQNQYEKLLERAISAEKELLMKQENSSQKQKKEK
jgi:hypothetical protein